MSFTTSAHAIQEGEEGDHYFRQQVCSRFCFFNNSITLLHIISATICEKKHLLHAYQKNGKALYTMENHNQLNL
jgi:hypothetical protein